MTESQTVDIGNVVETQEKGRFAAVLFLMCCLVMLVDGFNQQSLNYAAPAIIRDWGINRAAMTPVFDINIFGWMLGSVAFSMLADRIGRRNSILIAVFLFGVFTVALAFSTNLVNLSVIRFISALGIGGGMPMAIAMIADYSQTKSRGLKITLLYLGYTLICQQNNRIGAGMQVTGEVFELDTKKNVRWKFNVNTYPVDAHMIGGNRVMVAVYQGNRVT